MSKMRAEGGKLYAVLTLRDVVEMSASNDTPILLEIKRLYEENDRLKNLAKELYACSTGDFRCRGCSMWNGKRCNSDKMLNELGVDLPVD